MKYEAPKIVAAKKSCPPLSSNYSPPPVETGHRRESLRKREYEKEDEWAEQANSVEVKEVASHAKRQKGQYLSSTV